MDAERILREMLHTYNVNYGGALDTREAAALRAALTPWVTWMARPVFNPLRDDQLKQPWSLPDDWTREGRLIYPPAGFKGDFPDWAWAMTHHYDLRIALGGMHFWSDANETHSEIVE